MADDPDINLSRDEIAAKYRNELLRLVQRQVLNKDHAISIVEATLQTASDTLLSRPQAYTIWQWFCYVAMSYCKEYFRSNWASGNRAA